MHSNGEVRKLSSMKTNEPLQMNSNQRSRCWGGTIHLLLAAVIAVSAMASPNTFASDDTEDAIWKVGVASITITPAEPVFMSGYGGRDKPHQSVHADLHAKALAFEDVAGRRGVIMTADLVSIGGRMTARVCQRVNRETGLARNQILLNVSHTHAGPRVWLEDVRTGDSEPVAATKRNIARMEDRLVSVIVDAVANMKPAKLSWGTGVATFVMNRREFGPHGWKLGVNPRGLVDRSVPVLRVDSPDGKLRAVLFGTACHPTTSRGDNFAIDPDFPGHAQKFIEQQHPGCIALFMAGCGADANPFPRGTLELATIHGRTLGKEVCRVLDAELASSSGPLRTEYEEVDLPLQIAPPEDELQRRASDDSQPGWIRWSSTVMLRMARQRKPIPTQCTLPVAVWQFGDDVTLIGLPCEPVVGFVPLIEKAVGPNGLWIAGYCNEVVGYLPTNRVLKEGGYESRGIDTGPSVGQFSPPTEEMILESVVRLTSRARSYDR